MVFKYILYWLPMIVIAFTNAALRELVFKKQFDEIQAHQFSTITLIILCSIYIWLVFPLLNIQNSRQTFIVGLVWVLFTIAFEFTLGRLTNKTWEYLLRDYDLFAGRIWLLFLFSLFILPYLFYIFRNK